MRNSLFLFFALVFPMCATAQTDKDTFMLQYETLYKAYYESPGDVSNLLNLSEFYLTENNPLRNFLLAKKYMQVAEERYLTIIDDDKYYRDLSKLMKRGVTFDSVRAMSLRLNQLANVHLKQVPTLGMEEIEHYLQAFGSDEQIRETLYLRRMHLEYALAIQNRNADSCYRFLTQYAGTNLSNNIDTVISAVFQDTIEASSDLNFINDIASRYSECVSLQRMVQKRRGEIAYTKACELNTIEAYQQFLTAHSGSDHYMEVLQRMDDLMAEQLSHLRSAQDIVTFIQANDNSPLVIPARKRLLNKIFQDHDVRAIELYLDNFKMDSAYTDVFNFYYEWHSAEGNMDPLVSFNTRYPQFPFRTVLESDLQRAIDVDDVFLMEDFDDSKLSAYTKYIHRLTGKDISFVVLQRTLQNLIAAKDWQGALGRMDSYSLSFEDHCFDRYDALRQLLSAPVRSQRKLSVEVTPAYNMLNPVVHPTSGQLYYTKKERTGSELVSAHAVSGKNYKWKSDGQVAMDYNGYDSCVFTPFCFYDGGNKMLMGAHGDIWIAQLVDNQWQVVQKLPEPVNTPYIETDAYMAPDGSGILLASDRPGGYNGQRSGVYFHGDTAIASDIYFIPLTNRGWGEAINLGKEINSIYCEKSPILSRNMRTLYFVTDSRSGLGYGDVYYATRTSTDDWTSWSVPKNAGKEVNTGFDESTVSFSPDESKLIISSNSRSGRYGCYSVGSWHNPVAANYGVTILSKGLDHDMQAVVVNSDAQCVSDSVMIQDSVLNILLESGEKSYLMTKSTDSIYVPTIELPVVGDSVQLPWKSIDQWSQSGEEIILQVLSLNSTHDGFSPLEKHELTHLVNFLLNNPSFAVDIIIDVNGERDKAYNESITRGTEIKDYMLSKGLSADRIRVMPYGSLRVDGKSLQTRCSIKFVKPDSMY